PDQQHFLQEFRTDPGFAIHVWERRVVRYKGHFAGPRGHYQRALRCAERLDAGKPEHIHTRNPAGFRLPRPAEFKRTDIRRLFPARTESAAFLRPALSMDRPHRWPPIPDLCFNPELLPDLLVPRLRSGSLFIGRKFLTGTGPVQLSKGEDLSIGAQFRALTNG